MTLVKICGLTNLDDALVALEAGADFLGFILYDRSPRAVTLKQITPILQAIRESNRAKLPMCVGVQVNPTPHEVLSALGSNGTTLVDYVQLHKMRPDQLKTLRTQTNNHIFLAIQPQNKTELISAIMGYNALEDWQHPEVPQILVDAYHPTLLGGTGRTADLEIVSDLPDMISRMMLAGGLNPDNVGETIRKAKPWAVDVSSGVEASPGKKDHGKVRAFIQAVREADNETM